MKKKDIHVIQSPIETEMRNALSKRIDEFLKTIRSSYGSYKTLYDKGKTGALLKERGTIFETFQKTMGRTRGGIGLLNDPVLLSAIIEDTKYSAQFIFSDDTTPMMNMNLVLGPGTDSSLEKIIYKAVVDAQKPITRIAKIQKRLEAACEIFRLVYMMKYSNNYSSAVLVLPSYSFKNPQLYDYLISSQLSQISNFTKYTFKRNIGNSEAEKNILGKYLSVMYLVYEITRICNSYIDYSEKKERKRLSPRSTYAGFIFSNVFSKNELKQTLNTINADLKIVVDSIMDTGKIDDTNMDDIINHSLEILKRLMPNGVDVSSLFDKNIADIKIMEAHYRKDEKKDKKKKKNEKNNVSMGIQYVCEVDDDFKTFFLNLRDATKIMLKNNSIKSTNSDIADDLVENGKEKGKEDSDLSNTLIDGNTYYDEENDAYVSAIGNEDEIDDTKDDNNKEGTLQEQTRYSEIKKQFQSVSKKWPKPKKM